jgi:hypothetical protein
MTLNGLINRGWTQDLVETLLRDPDKIVRHPRWRCDASAWNIDRVLRAEKTSVFIAGRKSAAEIRARPEAVDRKIG